MRIEPDGTGGGPASTTLPVQRPPINGEDFASVRLLSQFYQTLLTRYAVLRNGEYSGAAAEAAEEIAALIGRERTWDNAYHVEQLLTQLFSGTRLRTELNRRIDELREHQPQVAAKHDAAANELMAAEADASPEIRAANDESLRCMLECVVDDLQWFYTKRYIIRQYGSLMVRRTTACGLLVLAFVAMPFFLFLAQKAAEMVGSGSDTAPATMLLAPFMKGYPNYGLFTACTYGMLGACFSMLVQMRQRLNNMGLDDARVNHHWRVIVLRIGVGMGGALILYFFLRTGALDGGVFPSFDQLGYEVKELQTEVGEHGILLPTKDMGLLVLWSFLAGFSETLVPSILDRTRSQLAAEERPA